MTAGRTNSNQLSRDWCTPTKYLSAVRGVLGEIDLDPCSNEESIVRAKIEYRLPREDGLALSWNYARIYVNPPYGSDKERGTRIAHWLRRCAEAHAQHGAEVIALIPVAVNTGHWKNSIWGVASAVCFLADPRVKFRINGREDGKGAPMACCMVYWGTRTELFEDVFRAHGAVVRLANQKKATTSKKRPSRDTKQQVLEFNAAG